MDERKHKPIGNTNFKTITKGIIKRVEQVRKNNAPPTAYIGGATDLNPFTNLNKSQFSSLMGLTPQTYNNFIGTQNSKPSLELVLRVCKTYHVNVTWLLFGEDLQSHIASSTD